MRLPWVRLITMTVTVVRRIVVKLPPIIDIMERDLELLAMLNKSLEAVEIKYHAN